MPPNLMFWGPVILTPAGAKFLADYIQHNWAIPANPGAFGQTTDEWASLMAAQVGNKLKAMGIGSSTSEITSPDQLRDLAFGISDYFNNEFEQKLTVAALLTKERALLVAVGATENLNDAQIEAVEAAGMIAVMDPAIKHAEIKVLDEARHLGLSPGALGTTHKICGVCRPDIEGRGGTIIGSHTAVFP